MSRIVRSAALAAVAVAGGAGLASARQPAGTYQQSYTYYQPSTPS